MEVHKSKLKADTFRCTVCTEGVRSVSDLVRNKSETSGQNVLCDC